MAVGTKIFFPPFQLDLVNEQLWRDEQLIALRPKTFTVLRYLVEHAGRLVTKEELLHAVWAGTTVSEEGLRDYLREIRHALGDNATAPRFVATVHGRGYRFLPTTTTPPVVSSQFSVVSSDKIKSSEPATKHWQLPTSFALPDKPSIIVLPFVNLSGDLEQDYFSDGMTEDLITDLSQLSGLFVIARNSSFYYKGKVVKMAEISQELGVRYVLEGSVRKTDSQVRITAQLVDATTNYSLWAERYDRPVTDIFALQGDIRQKIVTALRVKLLPEEEEQWQYFPTTNLEAYDYVLRGSACYLRFTTDANVQARQMFEQAIALDPQYAAAYALLGTVYFTEWTFFWSDNPRAIEQGFTLARRAVTLNDFVPVAHWLLGLAYLYSRQYEQAIAEEERALALAPNAIFGHVGLGLVLICVGRLEEAMALAERATRLDLHYAGRYAFDLGHAYYLLGRHEEALAALQKTLASHPNFLPAHVLLATVYSELGREAEARAEVAEVRRMTPAVSLEGLRQRLPYKDPVVLERRLAALCKAGLK
jgi:adenylate cyclase